MDYQRLVKNTIDEDGNIRVVPVCHHKGCGNKCTCKNAGERIQGILKMLWAFEEMHTDGNE